MRRIIQILTALIIAAVWLLFEVYEDVDGNREFDAAIDRPAGKLAET